MKNFAIAIVIVSILILSVILIFGGYEWWAALFILIAASVRATDK